MEVPEIDRVAWFEPAAARASIKASQVVFIDRLVGRLAGDRPAQAIYDRLGVPPTRAGGLARQ